MSTRTQRIGDRIVQVVLLLLIAGGIVLITGTLGRGGATGGSGGGAMLGASGPPAGGPGGGPPGAATPVALVETDDDGAVAVETETVGRATVREYIRVNGDVLAERTVAILPDTAGEIVERSVSVGQYVHRDQQIAVVDPSLPGQRFSLSPVLSTISGTVTAINVQVGDTVGTQTTVATVGDLSDLEIVTYLPERFVAAIDVGLEAEVTFEAFPGEEFVGRVVAVSPVLDAQSRTVEVTLVLNERDRRVKAGMFAAIRIVTAEAADILVAPANAVTSYYDQSVVYVVGPDGTAERRPVEIGLESSELVEITRGLAEGEQIIVAGVGNVTDGVALRIVNEEASL